MSEKNNTLIKTDKNNPNYKLNGYSIDEVAITSGYWQKWQEDNRNVTIPHSFKWLEKDGTIDNLRILNPKSNTNKKRRGLWFTDSDLYKALEGVSWEYGRKKSSKLNTLLDEIINIIEAAQEEDGYINSYVQAGLDIRWENLIKSHELYCIGHLIQAAIADKRSRNKEKLLRVAEKAAQLLIKEFGNNKRVITDGHQEIELALIELYRETKNIEYLNLAKQFIDNRGHGYLHEYGNLDSGILKHFDGSYYQDATPIREETTTVGHAVRAIYMLIGVIDLHLETGDKQLLEQVEKIWHNMHYKKTYVNGAVGSRFIGEAFGEDYELPPDLVYGETCASIGNVMLSWRLLLATGEAKYADMIEKSLYNLISASVSQDRKGFFYNNPAQRKSKHPEAPKNKRPNRADAPGTRPEWFECACCPPNIIRLIAQLSSYIYTENNDGIQIHQYIDTLLQDKTKNISISLTGNYQITGKVNIKINKSNNKNWQLKLRIPSWANKNKIKINGEKATPAIVNNYIIITRTWQRNDTITINFGIKSQYLLHHPAVDAMRGSVVLQRGPYIYALESPDQNSDIDINQIEIYPNKKPKEEKINILENEIIQLKIKARKLKNPETITPWRQHKQKLNENNYTQTEVIAIPYYLWANRGPSTMRIPLPIKQ